MQGVLALAAIYNLVWGGFVSLFPLALFRSAELPPPNYPMIWQCVGMVVGVYGVGYAIAATDPFRHWPITLVGLLGKILGPIGFLQNALSGKLPWRAGWVNITNDLVWWLPFTGILIGAYRFHHARA